MGKIRFLSSLVVKGSFAAILRPPPATPLTCFFLAVKVTVVMQHVAGDVHPAVEEQVAAGKSDVPPQSCKQAMIAALWALHDR